MPVTQDKIYVERMLKTRHIVHRSSLLFFNVECRALLKVYPSHAVVSIYYKILFVQR